MIEHTPAGAGRKYVFGDAFVDDYTRVRETTSDDGRPALFAYRPPRDGWVLLDLFVVDGSMALLEVDGLACPADRVDAIVEAIAANDLHALNRLVMPSGVPTEGVVDVEKD